MYCVRSMCLLVVIVLLYSSLVHCSTVNITLNATELASMNVPNVIVSDTVSIQCQTSGQNTYQVYNLSPAQFNTCSTDSIKIIGHCSNSPLTINIITLAMAFPEQVSYVAGTTYYYAAFETNNLGQISSNQPCLDGLKFSIDVESPAVSSSDTFSTSTNAYYITSSSYVQSSMAEEVSSTFTSSTSASSTSTSASSTSSSTQSATATYSTTASTQTSSSSGSSSDTLTIEPTIANIVSSAKKLPVYIGAGAVGGIVIAVIISIIVIIAVITCVIRYRQRNSEPYYINDTMEKGDTLRPMLNSPTHSAQGCEYETIIPNDNNNSIPITFQQNDKHFSQQISIQSEEESIKSTTSMDPLLGPSSPTAPSYTIPLNTIHEVAIANNKENNDSIEDNTSNTTNTDNSLYVTSSFNNTAKDVNDNGVVSTSDNSAVSSFDNNLLNLQHHFETNGEQHYHSIDERTNSNPWNPEEDTK